MIVHTDILRDCYIDVSLATRIDVSNCGNIQRGFFVIGSLFCPFSITLES